MHSFTRAICLNTIAVQTARKRSRLIGTSRVPHVSRCSKRGLPQSIRKGAIARALCSSSAVVVPLRAVIEARLQATLPEICALIRMGTDRFYRVFRTAPCLRGRRVCRASLWFQTGTLSAACWWVRRKNPLFTEVSPFGWICPSHREGRSLELLSQSRGGWPRANSVEVLDIALVRGPGRE
jgi:hypothetical protein